LAAFRTANRVQFPDFWNAPVPSFGDPGACLLIVGLAPGLRGANRTGRPFTGDYAGELLYATLIAYGFASGTYDRRPDDGLKLVDCAIVNAVRCVPPQNKPAPAEVAACRSYLAQAIAALPQLKIVLALGRIAHESALRALNLRPSRFPFAHGARHALSVAATPKSPLDLRPEERRRRVSKDDPEGRDRRRLLDDPSRGPLCGLLKMRPVDEPPPSDGPAQLSLTGAISLFDSYHCSRYNTNTGVLTEAMFTEVFASIRAELDRSEAPVAG
jgi:uracil-DNA glycosylase